METPDKIYVREYPDGSFNPAWESKRKDDPTTLFHEYIRKDIVDETIKTAEDHAYFAGQENLREKLLKWAKSMKRICKGAEPIEKTYQTIIDELNSM